MTASSALLISTPSVSSAKPTMKPDDKDHAEKLARNKDKDRTKGIKEKDDCKDTRKTESKEYDFESELDNASTTLETPIWHRWW